MNRIIILLAFVMMAAGFSRAADIHVKIETGQTAYHVGQTVNWSLYAWASTGNNQGVALISANLDDSRGEILSAPLKQGLEFADTQYGTEEAFSVLGWGVASTTAPKLRDMTVMQTPNNRLLNIGNSVTPRLLARGQYVVTQRGNHTLNVSLNGANYWPNATNPSVAFETRDLKPVTFGVYRRGDINFDGVVNSADLAILAHQFGGIPGSPSADIAPVNGDGRVDMNDFAILSSEWLMTN